MDGKWANFALTLVAISLLLTGCATSKGVVKNPARLKKVNSVAILPFTCNSGDVGYTVADSVTMKLMESRLNIIERSQLDRILREQGLSLTGIVENQEYMLGKIRGVDAIIVGSVTVSHGFAGMLYGGYVDYVSGANARMIDLRTGEVLMAVTFTSSAAGTQKGVMTPTKAGYSIGNEIIKKFK
jgi:hypothetical protein